MANITRYDPFAELVRVEPFRGFESMLPGMRAWWRDLPQAPEIRMDVTEDDKAYRVKAEIPGVKKEDIEVSIDGNQVSISAEVKRATDEKKGEAVIRSERYHGTQYRGFSLSREVDREKAEAKYADGVLELVLPKKVGAASQPLTIK